MKRLFDEISARPAAQRAQGLEERLVLKAEFDELLAEHPFVLLPSAVSGHSWNLLVSCDLAADKFQLVSQERFGLDTRLIKRA